MFGLNTTGSVGEPTGVGAQQMKSTGISLLYAGSSVGAAQACTDALTAGNLSQIYNTTGTQFDTTCKAYTTLTGAVNEQSEYELVDGRWYAGENLAVGRRRAQYDADASSGGYWENNSAC